MIVLMTSGRNDIVLKRFFIPIRWLYKVIKIQNQNDFFVLESAHSLVVLEAYDPP